MKDPSHTYCLPINSRKTIHMACICFAIVIEDENKHELNRKFSLGMVVIDPELKRIRLG